MSNTPRLVREDCKRTKHDSVFSQWEILIGPLDWESHSLGKDGVYRYRIHNLPLSCSSPGLYELGVAAVYTDSGRDVRKLDLGSVVVVYLGQADNVRTRLQHYGRVGSHLNFGKKFVDFCDGVSSKGPGLFREVFSRGFPIVFRWAPMENKKLAEMMEAQLLSVFDYAWNKGGNGARRPEDIFVKLDRTVSSNRSSFVAAKKVKNWFEDHLSREKKKGIKIKTFSSSALLKEAKFKRGVVTLKSESVEEEEHIVCGLSLGDGSVCNTRPVKGRQRCAEHKGKRNVGSSSKSALKGKMAISAVPLKGESACEEDSTHEGKSYGLHAGHKVSPTENSEWKLFHGKVNTACEVVSNNQFVCRSPFEETKVCSKRKGMKTNESLTNSVTERGLHICGVVLGDGNVCTDVPVHGRKRCGAHKGRRAKST